MDKRGTPPAPDLLSTQVAQAKYFFLNFARGPGALLFGGREQCNPDYAVTRTSFPYYVLEIVEAGRGVVSLDGKRHDLRAGSVYAYAPTTACAIRTDPRDPLQKFFFAFRGRRVTRQFSRAGVAVGETKQLVAPVDVVTVCLDLIWEGQKPGPLAPRLCDALVELLWLKIEEALASPASHEPAREAYLRCKARIDAAAATALTLTDLATVAGADPSTVCRWFRRFQGISPYQYLLRRKMNLAAQFLIENRGMVKEAAAFVGFADPYHFSRVFKSVHGVPPSALWARPVGNGKP